MCDSVSILQCSPKTSSKNKISIYVSITRMILTRKTTRKKQSWSVQIRIVKNFKKKIYTLFGLFRILPPTSVLCERNISKLKIIKNFLWNTTEHQRQSNLVILSIKKELVKEIKFSEIIDRFAETKCFTHSQIYASGAGGSVGKVLHHNEKIGF